MKRFSCVFCVFAPDHQLRLAAEHNPTLFADYVAAEQRMGHTFRERTSLVQMRDSLNARPR